MLHIRNICRTSRYHTAKHDIIGAIIFLQQKAPYGLHQRIDGDLITLGYALNTSCEIRAQIKI
ncbi:hypothetical protein D1872_176010 [compost metagenome]